MTDPSAPVAVSAVTNGDAPAQQRLTARGAATRQRLVAAAADLMYIRGVNAVTLDDVRAATGTSKSQLYKHFPAGKTDLIRSVVESRAEQILAREEQRLHRLRSMSGLRRWRDALMQAASLRGGAYGCALGSLAIEVSDQDEEARASLATHFAAWEGLLAAGLRRMQDAGTLSASADPQALAVGLMAALQGGYLLAKADHNVAAMATSLDMALAHIESLTANGDVREVSRESKPASLTAPKLLASLDAGALVLDARSPDDFASEHLRGSLNIGAAGALSTAVATVCGPATRVAIIVYPGDEAPVAERLSDAGFTDVVGFLRLAPGASFPRKFSDRLQSTRRTSPSELEDLLADDAVTVVDVRGDGDRDCGSIPQAIEIPLDDLRARMKDIPTGKPIVVHCAAGGRSSVAASLLRANGVPDVSDLTGGFQDWQRRGKRKSATKR